MNYMQTPPGKDPLIWHQAQKRAGFKTHFATYLLVNVFLWILWSFTNRHSGGIPWPAWTTLGWGIGIASHYMNAYVTGGPGSIEREYDKLTNQNK